MYLISISIVERICSFLNADGIRGEEKWIANTTSKEACAALVRNTETTANGATYGIGSRQGECFAEYGETGHDFDSTDWQTCIFTNTSKF